MNNGIVSPSKTTYTIYRIYNAENGKSYVGLTMNYKQRRRQHLIELRKGKHHNKSLQQDFNHYGQNHFRFEIMQQDIQTAEEAANSEVQWIAHFDTYYHIYNGTKGGEIGYGNGAKSTARNGVESGSIAEAARELDEAQLCLSFANTIGQDTQGNDIESLHSYADLVHWAVSEHLLDDADKRRLLRTTSSQKAQASLDNAYRLRGVVFGIFSAVAAGCPPEGDDIALLNDYLQQTMVRLTIQPQETGFGWHWHQSEQDDCMPMLWPVAWSAAQLLTSDTLHIVKECASDKCRYLFLDTSRNHSRRWCSMEGCGNRHKVNRYLERHQH